MAWPRRAGALEAVLDGLAEHKRLGVELYAVLVDPDVPDVGGRAWAEAWRVSDRQKVAAAPLDELTDALIDKHLDAPART